MNIYSVFPRISLRISGSFCFAKESEASPQDIDVSKIKFLIIDKIPNLIQQHVNALGEESEL